jgi:SAM-dependent methyltransferase
MHNCILCQSKYWSFIYDNSLKKCNSCGFVTANIEIDQVELNSIYTGKYFEGEEYLDYLKDKDVLQKNFAHRLNKINYRIESGAKLNALEIGCAYGFFGEILTERYKNAQYTGLDIAEEAIGYGKNNLGLNLILDDYLRYSASQEYTHVFMWDVIEHLPRPDLFIEKISIETMSGSELHITTGDIAAFLPRIQKKNWRMIHPPSHLHYFSKKTLILLLENYNFEIKSIEYKPVYRSVRQIFYSLFLLNKTGNTILKKTFEKIPENLFLPLNTYDIMHCVAVRK